MFAGMFFSGNILDSYGKHVKELKPVRILDVIGNQDDIEGFRDKQPVKLAGIITQRTVKKTKNEDHMAFVKFEDESGEIDDSIALEELLGISKSELDASLKFWRGAGVLTVTEESERITPAAPSLPEEKPTPAPESSKEEPKETRPARLRPVAELPRYTSVELADLLEARKEVNDFLRECQNVWGEMFNTHQTNTILGFVDYLGLEWDYILALLAFGVREQDKRGVKRSLRYVEKMAFDFYDEGITDLPALQEKICSLEKTAEVAANMTYLELSTYPGYMDSFVAACFLPHTDASLFPNSVQEM